MANDTKDMLEKMISQVTDIVFDNMRESIVVLDSNKHFVTANKAAYDTFPGIEKCSKGKPIMSDGPLGGIYDGVISWEEDCSFDFCNQDDAMTGWFEIRVKRMKSGDEMLGWILFILNETETMTLMNQLENWAFTDVLTGIPNRRYFIEQAEKEFARFKREKRGMSLMIMDIDKFKRINDFYGHQAGDEILWQVAEVIKTAVRPYDLFARFGGEEFIVLTTDITPEMGIKVAERIRQRVEAAEFEWHEHVLAVTISIGIAAIINEECTVDNAIFHADMKLLEAKESGRNNVKSMEIV